MKSLKILALGTALAAPGLAFAGGPAQPITEPYVAPVAAVPVVYGPDWTGFYGGAAIGYGDVNASGAALDGDGAIGGVFAGYRRSFGNLVGGLELDYDASDIDLGAKVGKLDNVVRIKGQLGTTFNRAFLYGTVGAAYADASVGAVSLNDWGYAVGVGMDYALTDQWAVGAEALYHNFNDFDNSGVDLDVTTVKARVSYKF